MKKIVHSLVLPVLGIFITACTNEAQTEESDARLSESSIIETTTNSTTVSSQQETSESTEVVASPTLEEFVGGWGIPYSEFFFFINSDGTASDTSEVNQPLPETSFHYTDDGRSVMTLHRADGTSNDFVLEKDGTLTTNGESYIYLGNITLEEFRANNAPTEETTVDSEPTTYTLDEAITAAKHFMADGNDLSLFDNYTFTSDEQLTDASGRPYYAINIRQNGSNGMKSMAIGTIIVYADNGECAWQ
ncbi:DUF4950 domain-containing protein [Candidatus Enterococcus willemsii]|uniref:DUF4950 domain-containing protein n=1 Tax=Candidatus Enterococcus willemsii TaxID=1857215 RepID=A0ABQ6YX44_9ENTE|nr:DUF4950 domain-containing protein [Enterococcus sp. CU12B]KAF1301940.1 hypothetical protein BAU17_00805 [Enterococcus sp. CU12B]